MRKVTGAAFVSLDGVMQAPGGPTEDPTGGFDQGGWVFGVGDDVIGPVLGRLFNPPYALLLGRRTYDIFAAYWPFVEGEMAGEGDGGGVSAECGDVVRNPRERLQDVLHPEVERRPGPTQQRHRAQPVTDGDHHGVALGG